MEPPGPGVPDRPRATGALTLAAPPRAPATRLAPSFAAGAALVLAISSRGDGLVLAAALAVVAARPCRALGAAAAVAGSLARWGTTTLGGVAGAQAVLGAAGWTGGGVAVASAWCGAVALTAAAPPTNGTRVSALVTSAPFGAAAALVLAGPGPGGALALRVVVALVATGVALLVSEGRRDRRGVAASVDVVALAAGGLALALGAIA